MRSARPLVVLGVLATVLSTLGVLVAIVVVFEHSGHPPHVDADLVLGLIGLFLGLAALGGSVALLLTGKAPMTEQSLRG